MISNKVEWDAVGKGVKTDEKKRKTEKSAVPEKKKAGYGKINILDIRFGFEILRECDGGSPSVRKRG